jgi:hypothetical protein
MSDLRKQVMAEIIGFMRDAQARGEDPCKAALSLQNKGGAK